MPGSDASQFTRFKKLNVSQTDQNIQGIPKNKTINTSFSPLVSNVSSPMNFMSSLRKKTLSGTSGNTGILDVFSPGNYITIALPGGTSPYNFLVGSSGTMNPVIVNGNGSVTYYGIGPDGLVYYNISITSNSNSSPTISGIAGTGGFFVYSTNITSIDVSGLTQLRTLSCNNNAQLSSLNVSGLTQLRTLYCNNNAQLSSLDVSGLTQLTTLQCNNNAQLSSLDVSGLTQLTSLECNNNDQLSSLNVSGSTQLTTLQCNNNDQLSSLNVSGLTQLTSLECIDNQLSSLNVSGSTQLTTLKCNSNNINLANANTILTALPNRAGLSAGNCEIITQRAGLISNGLVNISSKNWIVL
jgi:hypothetical protein